MKSHFQKNGESTFEALISMFPLLRTIQIWCLVFESHEDDRVYSEQTIQTPKIEYLAITSGYDWMVNGPSITCRSKCLAWKILR
jgi:hypothetical protein